MKTNEGKAASARVETAIQTGKVLEMPGARPLPRTVPKADRPTTEILLITMDTASVWAAPPFQRPLRTNAKVIELAGKLKAEGGIIPGTLVLGVYAGQTFLVDGQHRIEAFKLSGLTEAIAEVKVQHFESMREMADKFVELNGRLVALKPDDLLRAYESSSSGLQYIRQYAPYVGYDNIRRGASAPILSMSAVLRAWYGSSSDVPRSGIGSVQRVAESLSDDDAKQIVQFLTVVKGAWGKDQEYHRLWGGLNLEICMWLWRRTVLTQYSASSTRLTVQQFAKCMMALSAAGDYLEWLVGRMLTDRDRGPCYNRLKVIVAKRMEEETGKKPKLPAPAWSLGRTT